MVAQSMVEDKTRDDRLNRIQLVLGVSYESNLKLVRKTLDQIEVVETIKEGRSIYLATETGDTAN